MASEAEHTALLHKLQREKKARETAETLLEQKSLELYNALTSLEDAHHSLEKVVAERTASLEKKIAEMKALQHELEKAKKQAEETSALKSRFVATISHEIRTPLNGILGSLDLLMEENLPDKPTALVSMARTSGDILHTLLNDVIDFARSEAGMMQLEPAAFSIKEVFNETITFWQPHTQAKDCQLVIDYPSNYGDTYWGDPARIRQILNNYISNAMKYSGSDQILLSVEEQKNLEAPKLKISVTDYGHGINKDELSQLFTEFTRVGANKRHIGEGAGLGLAICKHIAELMGGSVGAQSAPNEKTVFWLTIPLKTAVKKTKITQTKTEFTPFKEIFGRRPKILVAEDVPTNQTIIKLTLESFGCRVTIVNNGVEAIEAVTNHSYDIVFMDIAMPEMDGICATRRIHELLGKTSTPPIYALTAHGMDEDREEFMAAGMVDIVMKPFNKTALYETINSCFGNINTIETKENVPMNDFSSYPSFDENLLIELIGPLNAESRTMLVNQCITDIETCETDIRHGLEALNADTVGDAMHKLKSLSGTFGFIKIHHISELANEAIKKGQNEVCLELAPSILTEITENKFKLAAVLSTLNE